MSLAFPADPDDCKILVLAKIPEDDGTTGRVFGIIGYYNAQGVLMGLREFRLSQPTVEHLAPGDAQKWEQLCNAIPETPPAVLAAVRNELPDEMFIKLWRGK